MLELPVSATTVLQFVPSVDDSTLYPTMLPFGMVGAVHAKSTLLPFIVAVTPVGELGPNRLTLAVLLPPLCPLDVLAETT